MAWIIAKESGMNNFNETVSEFLDEVISDYATGLKSNFRLRNRIKPQGKC
jgi:cell division septum initiation protein DivIVA